MLLSTITAEIFTSMDQLQRLSTVEKNLHETLDLYIMQERKRLEDLKGIYAAKKEELKKRERDDEVYHPLDVFRVINRVSSEWSTVEKLVRFNPHKSEFIQEIRNYHASFPSDADFDGTRAAMLRLQKVYNISSQSISSGVIPGQRNAHARLSGIDSYQIGRKAYEDGNIIQAKAWMENTLRMMGTSESLQNLTGHVVVSRNDVLNHLAFLEYKIGDLARSLRFYREMLVNDPNDTELQSNIRKLKHLIAKQPHLNVTSPPNTANRIEDDGDDELSREEMAEYTRLCRPNSQTRLPSSNKQLTCSYLNKHPGLKLKPVAMEIVSVNPQITLFHNVLSEMEIEQMLELARPRLRRARVNNLETGEIEDVDYRISQIAWLSDSDGDIVRRINRRVGFITGLNTNTGECLQVNNYGVGGHYEPHFDHSLDMENSPIASLGQGNRIATFMFYLSEVEAGGSTVFIKTGVKTNPFKGGAVFWYNLKKSGEGDWDSLHAGCPVLIGNKWVANKWLHEHGNEFTRQCGLTEDED
ncbi:predicted protein [Nematostella vectensis]|uniref:procollagen-proline 4-dioxygenase n=1 Tax=Nematostella vectensis TaxID=45351 RepID=A7SJ26_NEMVE|nr:predicted protein [Nematostella vectensis]|eukprot:XP_001628326.1 predicted protein [Nematostella vectensis]